MANVQFAFLEKSKVPSREEWQSAINQSGFNFNLDPELKPFEDAGFLPCTLMDSASGFEIFYDESSEIFEDFPELISLARSKDYCVSLRWGGSMSACASVQIASYALAKYFDAIVSYEGDAPLTLDELLDGAKQAILEI